MILAKKMLYVLSFCVLHIASTVFAHDFLLDPGHSPDKPGTLSCSGKYEYLYNEDLLSYIYTYLRERNIGVDVTREKGQGISLEDRAQKSKGKKLFLSIHHDSAHEKYIKKVNGYPCTDKFRGYSIFVSRKNPFFEKSLLYARVLGVMLYSRGLRPSRHHGEAIPGENRPLLDVGLGIYQYDDLIVLKRAHTPALLLEAAVIINPQDDALAQNEVYKRSIAESIEFMLRFVSADR